MDGDEGRQLREIHASVIRSEETIKWLKKHYEIQLRCNKEHEKRLTGLEIFIGRIKGIFATISTVVVLLTAIVLMFVSKLLWK